MSLPPVCGGGDAEGRGETPHARYRVRGWGPPPQSLRDSSPSGDLRVSPTAPTFPVGSGVTK